MKQKIKEIQKQFDSIAIEAFQSFDLLRDDNLYELAELEVYLIDHSKNIKDIYIHEDKNQLKDKNQRHLYWHYSGVDICMGDEDKKIYCGVLIRGIVKKEDLKQSKITKESVTYGPGRVAYSWNPKKERKLELVDKKDVIDLRFMENINKATKLQNIVFKLPRVNLSAKRTKQYFRPKKFDEVEMYLNLKARYIRVFNDNFVSPKSIAPAETRGLIKEYLLLQREGNIL